MMGKKVAIVAILTALVAPPAGAEVDSEGMAGAGSVPAAQSPEGNTQVTPTGHVTRSALTTGMVDREPQDSIETLSNDNVQLYYFTEVLDASGGTITHRWEWMGRVMAEVPFSVKGPRWRVFSSKNLDPNWLGDWTVTAVDASGRVLSRNSFTFSEASPSGEAPAPPAAPAN